jgi:DNA-binding NarL/FixJ family response regulator
MMHKNRILIVDDQQNVSSTVRDVLADHFNPTIRTTVEQGRKELREDLEKSNPRDRFAVAIFDLKFLNLKLGNATLEEKENAGLLLVNEARRDSFLEAIIMTVVHGDKPVSVALERGVFRYVKKTSEEPDMIWLDSLRSAALEAEAVRERWLSLYEDLHEFKETFSILEKGKMLDRSALLKLGLTIRDSLLNFDHLLRARGHHPNV